jgi:hypothetical protein
VKEKGGKPERKPYPLPYGFRNPYRNRSLRILKMMSRNLMTLYVHEYGFRNKNLLSSLSPLLILQKYPFWSKILRVRGWGSPISDD